ncbi:MAG: hypothetical protein IT343_21100 [Candidatus Melainabacteria bacterium]|jgi:hypothetical protein|nr:hypothetical protein [Candidatus Melainabacteria bacterium]
MSKYNRKEVEPQVAGCLIAAETLMDEARGKAFGPPSISITDNKFFSGKAQAFEIDRDKDGTVDSTGTVSYSLFGNIDKIDVTNKDGTKAYTIQFNRLLGTVTDASVDLKGDGTTDATLRPWHGFFTHNLNKIEIDANNDRTFDATIRFNRGFFTGDVYRASLDRNNDGTPENYYDLKRHWFSGRFNGLEPRKEE